METVTVRRVDSSSRVQGRILALETSDKQQRRFWRIARQTVEHIEEIVEIVRSHQKNGWSLGWMPAQIRIPMIAISEGKVSIELAKHLELAQRRSLIDQSRPGKGITSLPPTLQNYLCEKNATVKVVVAVGEPPVEKSITELTVAENNRVFVGGEIVSPESQELSLRSEEEKHRRREKEAEERRLATRTTQPLKLIANRSARCAVVKCECGREHIIPAADIELAYRETF